MIKIPTLKDFSSKTKILLGFIAMSYSKMTEQQKEVVYRNLNDLQTMLETIYES